MANFRPVENFGNISVYNNLSGVRIVGDDPSNGTGNGTNNGTNNGTSNLPFPLLPPPGDPTSFGDGFGQTWISTTKPEYLDPYSGWNHVQTWLPVPDRMGAVYDSGGLAGSSQTWIAPWFLLPEEGSETSKVALPTAIRQLLSWNREKYTDFNKFADHDSYLTLEEMPPTERYCVVESVSIRPRNDIVDTQHEKLAFDTTTESSFGLMGYAGVPDVGVGVAGRAMKMLNHVDGDDVITERQNTFPSIRGQWWEVELKLVPDKFTNRMGYRYCAIEIKPTTRMGSLKNVPLGIIPTGPDGNPNFDISDVEIWSTTLGDYGKSTYIDALTTGFPYREGQIEVVMRYPWVSIQRLMRAGPIGNPGQLTIDIEAPPLTPGQEPPTPTDPTTVTTNPHDMWPGMFLGTVNTDPFLGFPRGRVLYTSAELEESVSPVTGQLGYAVSNHFVINTGMEWNQSRYFPKDSIADQMVAIQPDLTPTFATGYMVMLKPGNTNIIYKYVPAGEFEAKAVYPYPYRDWKYLAYYGRVGHVDVFDPITSNEA